MSGLYTRTSGGNLRRTKKPGRGKTQEMRRAVYERDSFRCRSCGFAAPQHEVKTFYAFGWNPVRLQLDHVVPYKLGGQFTIENLQTLCQTCNSRKGASRA